VTIKNKFLILKSIVIVFIVFGLETIAYSKESKKFYIDPVNGDDGNLGTINKPFRSFQAGLDTVSKRVDFGITGDKIYLRKGIYKQTESTKRALYHFNLKGTPKNRTVISAMPAKPHSKGAVQRKSGKWYERVIFDDSSEIKSGWQKVESNSKIWKVKLPYKDVKYSLEMVGKLVRQAYNQDSIFFKNGKQIRWGSINQYINPAPFMMLQNGKPLKWSSTISGVKEPGTRYYDYQKHEIYIRPYQDIDPNTVVFETWNSHPNQRWHRTFIHGEMEYVNFEGFEFRLFHKIVQKGVTIDPEYRKKYPKAWNQIGSGNDEKNIKIKKYKYRYVTFEDIDYKYCMFHFFGEFKEIEHRDKWTNVAFWTIRNCRFFYSPRELLQLICPDSVFEYNEVYEPHPRYCPINYVSVCNIRRMPRLIIRRNLFFGNNLGEKDFKNKGGPFILWETRRHHRLAGSYDFYNEGAVIEDNFFLQTKIEPFIVMGRGGVRMRNITVRGNIFMDSDTSGILLVDPHINLRIHNNIFYKCNTGIDAVDTFRKNIGDRMIYFGNTKAFHLKNTAKIYDNIFMECRTSMHKFIYHSTNPSDKIEVIRNLFYDSGRARGLDKIKGNPLFKSPDEFDFRLTAGSPAIIDHHDIGVYDFDSPIKDGTDWWRYKRSYFLTPEKYIDFSKHIE
jgi:hypothetical protein